MCDAALHIAGYKYIEMKPSVMRLSLVLPLYRQRLLMDQRKIHAMKDSNASVFYPNSIEVYEKYRPEDPEYENCTYI